MMAMAFASFFALYFLYPAIGGKTIAVWTWLACNSANGFLHGRLVFLIFPFLVWIAWKKCNDKLMKPSSWGLFWLGIGCFFFLVALRLGQPRLALVGAPFFVLGFTHFLFGWEVAKSMVFPAFFLWFAIPIPEVERFMGGTPRIMIADLSYHTGLFLGMDLSLSGNSIEVSGREASFGVG